MGRSGGLQSLARRRQLSRPLWLQADAFEQAASLLQLRGSDAHQEIHEGAHEVEHHPRLCGCVVHREGFDARSDARVAPVLSSNNIQTITLAEAQAMFPPPRPPSPTSRARAQKLRLAESNPNTLTPKDAEILMSLQKPNVPIAPPRSNQRAKRESKAASMLSFGSGDNSPGLDSPSILFPAAGQTPPSPTANSRFVPSSPTRRLPDPPPVLPPVATVMSPKRDANSDLLDWVNSRLPPGTPKATNFTTSWRSGQLILRLAEVLSGRVKPGLDDAKFARIKPDSDEELDVGFDVYDFLTLDLAIETGDVSLGELMRGERQQIIKLVEAVRTKYGA